MRDARSTPYFMRGRCTAIPKTTAVYDPCSQECIRRPLYAPNKTQAVWDCCWGRGYVRVLIGGGLSGCVQVNDTHCHGPLSKDYQAAEMQILMNLSEEFPDYLPSLSKNDCINILLPLWCSPKRHEYAARGFLDNMLTNALDGSQDALASESIRKLWLDLDMDGFRAQAMCEVTAMVGEGLEWTSRSVQDLVGDYVKNGFLDDMPDEDEGDLPEDDPGQALVKNAFSWDVLQASTSVLHTHPFDI